LTRPLLVVDGDSLAHRAYHALPSSIRGADRRPANAIVGFANMLLGLWDAEAPRAVLVGWDTLDTPTYRHEAFAGYQAGRVFDAELLEQLDVLPEVVSALGFATAKAPGYEADDFLAAAVAAESAAGGTALVATSDRDAFQLVGERTTVLRLLRGISQIERVDPERVRELYGVEPAQVPDFVALRGDPSDGLPGAPGVGPKKAAEVMRRYGSLENALDAGRFGSVADDLRLYKRLVTMDSGAPLPPLADQAPSWDGAARLLRAWGLNQLATRLEQRAAA
jgi:DNA polymerase I